MPTRLAATYQEAKVASRIIDSDSSCNADLRVHISVDGISREEFVSAPACFPRSRLDQCTSGV